MKHVQAMGLFILAVILAGGVFWWLWTTQVNFGRSVEGTRAIAELQMRREALTAQRPSSDMMGVSAKNGCCNYLEHPTRGSQLMIDVPPGGGKCYEHDVTQSRVKVGFIVVDIEPHPCEKRIVV